jgi:hypothetical protein
MVKERAQFIASGIYIKHVLEKLTSKGKGSVLNRFGGFFLAAVVAAFAVRFGAECIATGVYIKHFFDQLTIKGKGSVLNRLTGFFFAAAVAVFAILIGGTTARAQNTAVTGSVPSGPASDQVLELTLRTAIKMALRYNLGAIESGQNAQIARGQPLLALSNLLPQVTAGASETVQQLNLGTVGLSGLNVPAIPTVVGPFSYSSVDASISQTLFSYEAIDGQGHIGIVNSHGLGGGEGLGGSARVSFGGSNAKSICGLQGPFVNVSGTAGVSGLGGTGDYFTGKGDGPNGVVDGGGVTIGVAGGASGSVQVTDTKVSPFGRYSCP